jgi:hypothetical protein
MSPMSSTEKVGGQKMQQAGGLTEMLGLTGTSKTGGRRRRRTSKGSRRKRSSKKSRRRR